MSKLNRRSFFKLSTIAFGTIAFFKKTPNFISSAIAAVRKDDGITKLNYVGDVSVNAPTSASAKKFYENQLDKVVKFFSKPKNKEEFKVADADQKPYCKYCKFYTAVDGEWGWCTQVAKKDNKENQMVAAKGWCQMFNLQSTGNLKKILGA